MCFNIHGFRISVAVNCNQETLLPMDVDINGCLLYSTMARKCTLMSSAQKIEEICNNKYVETKPVIVYKL